MAKLSPGEVESLSQLRKVSGTGGFKFLENSTAHTNLSGYAIVCNTDCVFSVFNVNGVNSLAKLGLTGTGTITVKQGSYLPVAEGESITDVRMSTGDCIIYNL